MLAMTLDLFLNEWSWSVSLRRCQAAASDADAVAHREAPLVKHELLPSRQLSI
jgi:hypothetical protein